MSTPWYDSIFLRHSVIIYLKPRHLPRYLQGKKISKRKAAHATLEVCYCISIETYVLVWPGWWISDRVLWTYSFIWLHEIEDLTWYYHPHVHLAFLRLASHSFHMWPRMVYKAHHYSIWLIKQYCRSTVWCFLYHAPQASDNISEVIGSSDEEESPRSEAKVVRAKRRKGAAKIGRRKSADKS